jgi:TRAP-type C4-dicarboxylate transport system permease small subunit
MSKVLDRFETWFNAFNTFIAALVATSIGAFAILIPFDLLLRKMSWGNLPWLGEGIEYALYVGVFLSAAWVLQKGAHVRVDIIVAALPQRTAMNLERALDLVGALLCAVLCYYGISAAIIEYTDQTLPDKDLRIDNWYMMVAFALAFAMLTVEFLFRFRRAGETSAKSGF